MQAFLLGFVCISLHPTRLQVVFREGGITGFGLSPAPALEHQERLFDRFEEGVTWPRESS